MTLLDWIKRRFISKPEMPPFVGPPEQSLESMKAGLEDHFKDFSRRVDVTIKLCRDLDLEV